MKPSKTPNDPTLTRPGGLSKTSPVKGEGRTERDLAVITRFIEVFCEKNHKSHQQHAAARPADGGLCDECRDLLNYAADRLARCPMDPKPKCKDCPVHCYKPEYRRRIQEVMRFSGIYFVKRGRVDWLIKYFS
jgi:hypothetical protein